MMTKQSAPLDYVMKKLLVHDLIGAIGDDPEREGVEETPARVVRSWQELFSGYDKNPADILSKTFAAKYDQMVSVRDIEFFSFCEHHMLPFYGVVHVAYIPKKRVVGLSKIPRLVECFARRLQIQERMTTQIAESMHTHLQTKGVGVVVQGTHTCMLARGVKKSGVMTTSDLRGVFRRPEVRAEFFTISGIGRQQ